MIPKSELYGAFSLAVVLSIAGIAASASFASRSHSTNMSLISLIISLSGRSLFRKGQTLFKAGDELKSLYAIRSGTIKSYTITEQGDEQITGFHLAGDSGGI